VKYLDEDAALKDALQAQEESDKEEGGGSVLVILMNLREATSAAQVEKIFAQENQDNVSLCPYIGAIMPGY